MTDGEKMIWAAAYVAAFNEQGPNWIGANATLWEHYTDEVQQAVGVGR